MTLISILLALAAEQWLSADWRGSLRRTFMRLADRIERHFNAGEYRHGVLGHVLAVAPPVLASLGVYTLLLWVHPLLALLWNAVVLYFTMGFRQFSHRLTEIQIALANGDLPAARHELAQWKAGIEEAPAAAEIDADEVVRQSCEHGLQLAHKHVFGVLFWFVLLPGPIGPILFRLAEFLARRWNRPPGGALPADRFGEFARRAFAWIDWLPARLTALGFAIVGDFEGAIYCWRKVTRPPTIAAGLPQPDSRTVILAAAGGALGSRVLSSAESARYFDEAGLEGGGLAEPGAGMLSAAVGLVWRALLLWLVLLLLITLAGWLT